MSTTASALNRATSWTAWAAIMAVALAIACYSVVLSFIYAKTWGGDDPWLSNIYAGGAAALDVFKVFAVILIVGAFMGRRWLTASAMALAFPLMVVLSVFATFGATAINKSTEVGEKAAAAQRVVDLRAELAANAIELDPVSKARPSAVINSEISAMKRNRRWELSRGCTDATSTDSRTLCADYDRLFAELAGAQKASRLRDEAKSLRAQIASQMTAETVGPVAPDLAILVRLTGWDRDRVIELRALIFASIVEVVAAFGVGLVWHNRPQRPAVQTESGRFCREGPNAGTHVATETPTSSALRTSTKVFRKSSKSKTEKASKSSSRTTSNSLAAASNVVALKPTNDEPPAQSAAQLQKPLPIALAMVGKSPCGALLAYGSAALAMMPQAVVSECPVEQFMAECLVAVEGAEVQSKIAYEAFTLWSSRSCIETLTLTTFGRRLKDLGVVKRKREAGIVYCGLELRK